MGFFGRKLFSRRPPDFEALAKKKDLSPSDVKGLCDALTSYDAPAVRARAARFFGRVVGMWGGKDTVTLFSHRSFKQLGMNMPRCEKRSPVR